MKKTDWKGTAELIGIAAIVASLVFVGLELRQNTAAVHAAAPIVIASISSSLVIPNLSPITEDVVLPSVTAGPSLPAGELTPSVKTLVKNLVRITLGRMGVVVFLCFKT